MAVDPLELLKAANNPALTQTNVNAQKTANDLTAGLAKLNSQRTGQLNLANINNAGAADRTAMGQGFTGATELRNSSPALTLRRGLENALTGSTTNLNNSGALVNRAKGGFYPNPPLGSTAKIVQDIETPTKQGTPIGEASAAAGKMTNEKSNAVEKKQIVSKDGSPIGFTTQTTKQGDKTKVESKGPLPKGIQDSIIAAVRKKYPNAKKISSPVRDDENDTTVKVTTQEGTTVFVPITNVDG